MGTDLYKQDLGSIPPVSRLPARHPLTRRNPRFRIGNAEPGDLKILSIFDWEHRRFRNPTFHFFKIAGGLDCPIQAV